MVSATPAPDGANQPHGANSPDGASQPDGHIIATRTDTPTAWDERTMLTTFLDYTRATVHAKCVGLSDADARRAPLPGSPLTTISSLVSHLRWVEYSWLEIDFLGGEDHAPWTDEDPDREMRIALDIPLRQLLDEYAAQCARYRDLVASHDLDTLAKRPFGSGKYPTLRWILFHLVEETARHNGHIDLLREMADGTTGD
ncbi:MAG: DinB family protein [Actinocatenispora sp.]